jgi:hypothetical protein
MDLRPGIGGDRSGRHSTPPHQSNPPITITPRPPSHPVTPPTIKPTFPPLVKPSQPTPKVAPPGTRPVHPGIVRPPSIGPLPPKATPPAKTKPMSPPHDRDDHFRILPGASGMHRPGPTTTHPHITPIAPLRRPRPGPERPVVIDNHPSTIIKPGVIQNNNSITQYFHRRPGGYSSWESCRVNYWNDWAARHAPAIADFHQNRWTRWDHLRDYRTRSWQHYSSDHAGWLAWQRMLSEQRRYRAYELWDSIRDFHCHLFTPDWWSQCPWHRWHHGHITHLQVSPWWWWQPAVWSSFSIIYGAMLPQPVLYDYGTDIVAVGDQIYLQGVPHASRAAFARQAIALANVNREPLDVTPDGDWVPLGVWALTQEEQGDATLFYQLSINSHGQISGAYTNVITGEISPVIGMLNQETQRVAFRVGENGTTVIECALNGLTQDVTSVFVHFGENLTQTWLMVRLNSPDLPATPVPTSR